MLAKQFSNLENNEIKYEKMYQGHQQGVENVEFFKQNQNRFMSCSHDDSLKIWDINSEKCLNSFDKIHENGIWDFVIDESNNSILSVSPDSKLIQTDFRTGQKLNSVGINVQKGYSISHQNNQILIGGQNGKLTFVDERKMEILKEIEFLDQIVYKTETLQNKNWVVSTSLGKIHVIDSHMNEIFNCKIFDKEIRAFTVDQNDIYMSCKNHKIQKFEIDIEKKQINKLLENEGHQDEVRCFYVDTKNQLLFTGSSDSSLFVWSTKDLGFRHNLIGHKDLVSSIDINSQSTQMITGSWDQTCLRFDLEKIKLN